jgi:hypothetical protein
VKRQWRFLSVMKPQTPATYFSRGTAIAAAAITACFIVLIVSAFMLAERTTVTAALPAAKQARPAETLGTAAYPLADGKTCRELVFDRFNSEIIESKTRRCREPRFGAENWSDLLPMMPAAGPGRASNGFKWGKS